MIHEDGVAILHEIKVVRDMIFWLGIMVILLSCWIVRMLGTKK